MKAFRLKAAESSSAAQIWLRKFKRSQTLLPPVIDVKVVVPSDASQPNSFATATKLHAKGSQPGGILAGFEIYARFAALTSFAELPFVVWQPRRLLKLRRAVNALIFGMR